MSLMKKDPSLRVAANEPHFVSLGGGRLSTAVTIHNIPIGDMTIGSSTTCSISLNGTGVRPIHCTIYRSEENEVTIVPERDARILIDGTKITQETNLTQGAMITIGNSNYLRFNNPAEAQMMRSAMGSNERISMPQIDFTQVSPQHNSDTIVLKDATGNPSNGDLLQSMDIESFYESTINPTNSPMTMLLMDKVNETGTNKGYKNLPPIDINGLQCPKVFTADLVTVNMPAKDVLGQKYANFAKNLAENHRVDKNITNTLKNNQCPNNSRGSGSGIYVNIPSTSGFIQNTNVAPPNSMNSGSTEYLTKVNNTTPLRALNSNNHHNINAYDRYPKPGTYGGLQIFPMNGVNTEINNGSPANTLQRSVESSARQNLSNISNSETERLEDMLKICTEYADRQNQSNSSITSSPIVQNRIKTNGSLPRDKKSPFYHELSGSLTQQCNGIGGSSGNLAAKSLNGSVSSSSGYENVRLVGQNRVEINGQAVTGNAASPKSGYENVVIGKYVPQSPRTKIRTICMSPKKEHSFSNAFNHAQPQQSGRPPSKPQLLPKPTLTQQSEYDQLIKTFEEKLKLEMQAIEASSRYQPNSSEIASAGQSPAKRSKKNINNLTLNLYQSNSLQNSPKLIKKPAPAPRSIAKKDSNGSVPGLSGLAIASSSAAQREEGLPKHQVIENGGDDVDQLKRTRKELLHRIQRLKTEISDLQKQEDETLRELHLEKALVSAELSAVGDSVGQYEKELQLLQQKVHRMEAQRNSTRVMEENQQAKLKQSIEMKQDQVKKLKALLKQKSNNDCLKEELHNVAESLENDRKTFEDLEFQYLEEESEWHAYREELHTEEKGLTLKIEEKRMEMQHLERQELTNQNSASNDAKTLKTKLLVLLNSLQSCQAHLKTLDTNICDLTGQLHIHSSDEEDSVDDKLSTSTASPPMQGNLGSGMMSQSLFGSAELLCPKRSNVEDIMSKSVNENMFYNNKIELPIAQAASTPKRPQMQLVDIKDADLLDGGKNHQLKAISIRSDQNTNELDEQSAVMAQNDRVKFNLSLDSDDFEVNPLERRVPSQDDIDRISKLTLDTPISTKGASTKIFDSIKEIERNRQLLLAQQGHHVIEHERQKMNDLKKKSHDEARAQYLSMLSNSVDGSSKSSPTAATVGGSQRKALEMDDCRAATKSESLNSSTEANQRSATDCRNSRTDANPPESEHRHSQPEYESQHREQQRLQHQLQHQNSSRSSPRPLSDANSELSCDLLAENIAISSTEATCKSILELSTTAHAVNRYSAEQNTSGDDTATTKRSSLNSNDTNSGGSGCNERKRMLPKHQRPLTRYLPIFSPDLNLRHHIESAGHQIAVCPHVFVDAYSCRGYLHKLGATFHGWARRWFVLDRQRSAFIYYADKSERKPRGGAYFSTIDEVYLDHLNASKSGRPHCTLIVKTKKRSYHLQAASDAAARIWIDAIITGAQGNLDY